MEPKVAPTKKKNASDLAHYFLKRPNSQTIKNANKIEQKMSDLGPISDLMGPIWA